MGENYWTTRLSETTADGIRLRGYDLTALIGAVPFSSVIYLLYTGELPSPPIARLIDAILVASIDHGAGTPSVLAARTAASGGAPLQSAAAAGLLSLGKFHGAAVQDSMEAILQVVDRAKKPGGLDASADEVAAEWRAAGRRISGFGHRQHKRVDPRMARLFELGREAGLPGEHIAAAHAISAALTRKLGREMPINIDGAVAALLCEINFPITLANALFISSRITGLLAHANEEITTMPPMRRIDPVDHAYDGPQPRDLA